MQIIKTSRQIGQTIRNAGRLRTIVGVFAKHGFHNVAERIKLGRFLLQRLNPTQDTDRFTVGERIRMSFEELGPTFVKLGQLLAARPDLVPEDFVAEFSKLHDNVQPLPFEVIEEVLREEFGEDFRKKFVFIEPQPVGSASIAQVHRATLSSGEKVVIKVQRPGLIEKINDDLNVLYFLAELIERYIPESRPFNPVQIVDEYFKTLELETNFIVEANNLRRFQENFADDPSIKIPVVYFELTTERVLTMEALLGTPLSQTSILQTQNAVNPAEVVRKGLRAYLKMVFQDGFFHGDLHAGNFFVLPDNQIGLVDFGVVGRLNQKTKSAIASMLVALSKEDYDRLAFEFVELAPFSERVNVDIFAKELRDLIAPFYGLTLNNVNLGKILLSSAGIGARNGLSMPSELMLFFKSLISIEGLGKRIQPDFDFLSYALEFAAELVKAQYDPQKLLGDISQFARESKSLINSLPRQLNFLFRRINSPDYATRIQIQNIDELKKSFESSFNLLFLGIIIAALLGSASFILVHPTDSLVAGIPTFSFVGYITAIGLGIIAFFNYIKK
jgi:ubiquinone biosynthesis protein